MAKIRLKIVLEKEDIKKLIAEKYNLKLHDMSFLINHYVGDAREPEYTSIVIEADSNDEVVGLPNGRGG